MADWSPAAPFPVQPFAMNNGESAPRTFIPMWQAKIVHRLWLLHNPPFTLEQIADNGGFGPMVILDLLAGGTGKPTKVEGHNRYLAFDAVMRGGTRSIKNHVEIVVAGTPEYERAKREIESEAKERARAPRQVFYGNGGQLVDKPR